jgi:hypothetical protein
MEIMGFIHTNNYHQVLRLQQTFGKYNFIPGIIHAVLFLWSHQIRIERINKPKLRDWFELAPLLPPVWQIQVFLHNNPNLILRTWKMKN